MQAESAKRQQRSCITCGERRQKTGLYRIVRSLSGAIFFDPSGRLPGRGAYVCSVKCFVAACKSHKLDRALRVKLDEALCQQIANDLITHSEGCVEED